MVPIERATRADLKNYETNIKEMIAQKFSPDKPVTVSKSSAVCVYIIGLIISGIYNTDAKTTKNSPKSRSWISFWKTLARRTVLITKIRNIRYSWKLTRFVNLF